MTERYTQHNPEEFHDTPIEPSTAFGTLSEPGCLEKQRTEEAEQYSIFNNI